MRTEWSAAVMTAIVHAVDAVRQANSFCPRVGMSSVHAATSLRELYLHETALLSRGSSGSIAHAVPAMEHAVTEARRAYELVPGSYTMVAFNAVLAAQHVLLRESNRVARYLMEEGLPSKGWSDPDPPRRRLADRPPSDPSVPLERFAAIEAIVNLVSPSRL